MNAEWIYKYVYDEPNSCPIMTYAAIPVVMIINSKGNLEKSSKDEQYLNTFKQYVRLKVLIDSLCNMFKEYNADYGEVLLLSQYVPVWPVVQLQGLPESYV